MVKNNLAFDIDGIVANFSDPFVEFVLRKYGVEMIRTGQFHWATKPTITDKMFKEFIAEFIRRDKTWIPVIEGADVVYYLWDKTNDPVLFVTARDISTAGATHRWLWRNFPDVDFMLSIVHGHSYKYNYLKNYDCYLEDRRRTCVELASKGKTVFMPIRDYNYPLDLNPEGYKVLRPVEWKSTNEYNKIKGGKIFLLEETKQLCSGIFDDLIFK